MGILQNIIKSINTAIDSIDFSPYQLISNKSTDETLADNSDTKYPSQKAVKTYADTKQSALGYTAENQTNKENTTLDTSSTKYPTNNLVKTNLDLKQSTSEKNQANGYLGLNDISRIESIFTLIRKNKFSFYHCFLNYASNVANLVLQSSSTSGGGVFSNSGSNAVKTKNTLSSAWNLPTLYLSANASGSVNCNHSNINIRLDSNSKIEFEAGIAYKITSKQCSLSLGIGTFSKSSGIWSGNGVLFTLDPTVNSGKWRCGKIVSNIFTPNNLDVITSNESLVRFRIKYDKTTEIALFYLNDVLVYTLNSVNLSDIVYSLIYNLETTDNTESTVRATSILYHALEIEINQ